MRSIAPLSLPDLTPADLAGLPGPDFDLVPPAELLVDDSYQRDLSPRSLLLIRRIVEGWSWSKFKPPICAKVDGRLHVIDGQHTAIAAATHGGISIIPVVVVAAPEFVERANAFVSHARDRLSTTPGQVFHAEVAAGDSDAVEIAQVCQRAGVTLLPFSPSRSAFRPGETVALSSIRTLAKRRGAALAETVLSALANAECAPVSSDLIKAAEALLCEDEYALEFDPTRLTASIRDLGPSLLSEAKQLSAAKCLPMWRSLAAVLFKHRKARRPAVLGIHTLPSGGRLIDRRPDRSTVDLGEPAPGRSALDQRRRQLA